MSTELKPQGESRWLLVPEERVPLVSLWAGSQYSQCIRDRRTIEDCAPRKRPRASTLAAESGNGKCNNTPDSPSLRIGQELTE